VSAGALAELRPEPVLEVLRSNAVGPILVTQALAPLLAAAGRATVVNLSSGLGSLTKAVSRGNIAYGMSKAALNMLTRHLAAELRHQGTIVVSMSPGWVSTDMGGPSAPLGPPESVQGILNVVAVLTPAQSGSFLDHTGATVPW
jgi:NAD(P)-dependent dehydrogenase (short-subunit alcohol dehydrogenase family)